MRKALSNGAPVGEILSPDMSMPYVPRSVWMHPEPEAESRGHQVHHTQCLHRKRCYYYHTWTCADCGAKL
jgi:hypothetical protein